MIRLWTDNIGSGMVRPSYRACRANSAPRGTVSVPFFSECTLYGDILFLTLHLVKWVLNSTHGVLFLLTVPFFQKGTTFSFEFTYSWCMMHMPDNENVEKVVHLYGPNHLSMFRLYIKDCLYKLQFQCHASHRKPKGAFEGAEGVTGTFYSSTANSVVSDPN